MKTSAHGLDIIKKYEGFKPKLYNCPAGHCTIGYGHLVHRGPVDGRACEQPFQNGLTPSQADALLQKDVEFSEMVVMKDVKVPLNQNQFDALVDFVFNLGEGTLQTSTLLQLLNENDYKDVHEQIERFDHANHKELRQLHERRDEEANLFDTPQEGAR